MTVALTLTSLRAMFLCLSSDGIDAEGYDCFRARRGPVGLIGSLELVLLATRHMFRPKLGRIVFAFLGLGPLNWACALSSTTEDDPNRNAQKNESRETAAATFGCVAQHTWQHTHGNTSWELEYRFAIPAGQERGTLTVRARVVGQESWVSETHQLTLFANAYRNMHVAETENGLALFSFWDFEPSRLNNFRADWVYRQLQLFEPKVPHLMHVNNPIILRAGGPTCLSP